MAGFFDFMKKSDDKVKGPVVTQTVTQTQSVPQAYSGIGPTPGGGTPYNGIGPLPNGAEPYSGIGNPPAQPVQTATTTTVKAPQAAQSVQSAVSTVQSPTQTQSDPVQKPEEKKSNTDKSDKKTVDDKQKTDEDLVARFSERSKAVIAVAQGKAKEQKSTTVESEHLLLGLLSDNEVAQFLTKLKVQIPQIQEEIKKLLKSGTNNKDPEPSPQVKKILTNSVAEAEKTKSEHVEPEHILLAIINEGENAAARILITSQIKKEDIEKAVLEKSLTEKPKTPEELKKEELDLMTHLTQRSNRVFLSAQTKAKELKNQYIDSEHLLHGLLADTEIYNFFVELKLQPQTIEEELTKIYKKESFDKSPQISPRIKRILDNSLVIARKLGFEFISPEHLLLALYEEGEGAGARVLAKIGLKKEDLNKKITGKKEGLDEENGKTSNVKKDALSEYTIDLTAKAAQGLLDKVVERSEVIERVIHILSRRTKNNPALVGEAGVGKTAIVEGLAQKIVSKEVPEPLLNKKILQLDLMGVLAGASHRGEFEERMKNLIEEIKSSQGQYILFIDEIHNIVGAGSSGEGSMDASNFLKPALARGEVQLIGATTLTEYRKYIEKDPALERRFQPVLVPEPTEEQAIKMLQAIKDKYEAFHKVTLPQDVLEASVKLSKRYVGDRFLPDKAVDLIDEAASAVRLPLISLPEEVKSLETRVAELSQELTESEQKGDKVKARIIRSKIDEIKTELKEKQDQYNLKKGQSVSSVTVEIVKDVVARWTGIPVSKITGSEVEKLAKLEEIMHERLIDQEVAVASVAQAVRRGRAGLKSTQRPIGSFVFLGPTGVGKTELAKTLADILFGQEEAMIRFDMTEYMEKHEVAKLLGAPPGYVGYEEGGKLTEAVRRRPYSVVLFDEVEKAHPDIFNILLQILDDGRLTDNKGHVISFKNTVVICTSNIGTQIIQDDLLRNGKTEVEEPPMLSSYVFSPHGREILSIGPKYFVRTVNMITPPLEDKKEDLFTFKTLAYSPRGRRIVTIGKNYFEKEFTPENLPSVKGGKKTAAKKSSWKKNLITEYFSGQKIELPEEKDKQEKVPDFPLDVFDTHAISSEGIEVISRAGILYYRTSTTSKVWKTVTLIDYVKDNVVVNALPDAPDQQLPTAQWQTHAFSLDEHEVVTLKDRYWRRKEKTTDWETGFLKDYFVNQTLVSGENKKEDLLPIDHWDIHTFSPDGQEMIVVGEEIYIRKTTENEWKKIKLVEFAGEDFPAEKKKETVNVTKKTSAKDQKEEQKNWQAGMLLDYFAGQAFEEKKEDKGESGVEVGKNEKPTFPIQGYDTQSISPKGVETITKGNLVYYRDSTTSKVWKATNLIELFKDNVVVNAIPDAPEEMLPTVKLKTHAYDAEGNEIVSYRDRYWKRKGETKEWETGNLKDYFVGAVIDVQEGKDEKLTLPTTHWDIHTFSPSGKEIIIVGDRIWYKETKEAKWLTKTLKDYFGNDFPLEKEIEEKNKVEGEIDRKKYDVIKDKVMGELRKFFRPELINRFDEVIIFEPLRFIHMMAIVKLQLKSLRKLLEDQEMGFMYTDAAIKEIVRAGFDPVYGARPLRRAIQKLIENPISSLIIEGKVKPGDQILVDFDGDDFVFNIEKVELVDASKLSQGIKNFLCEKCGNKFKTEVLKTATVICSKCASTKVQEITKEEKKNEEMAFPDKDNLTKKRIDEKTVDHNDNKTLELEKLPNVIENKANDFEKTATESISNKNNNQMPKFSPDQKVSVAVMPNVVTPQSPPPA